MRKVSKPAPSPVRPGKPGDQDDFLRRAATIPEQTAETPSQEADRIYAEQHPEQPEAASEVLNSNAQAWHDGTFSCPICATLRAALKKAEEEARGLLQSLTLCRKELGSVRGKLQDERSKAALR